MLNHRKSAVPLRSRHDLKYKFNYFARTGDLRFRLPVTLQYTNGTPRPLGLLVSNKRLNQAFLNS